ncbi:hypothetical protein [Altericroceibacterium endophyticum]|uniref:Uncharacterized protein n=1 Tax=Altericroceibacterium endophyticum TaxID=1808508 RepID=A0A6I4T9A6_9SPHN|nr:hypothetical protein [Altericroceibacterium endophyticum]MXO66979.1 hypothetical protein [Altericroceibacterium endophyticum]
MSSSTTKSWPDLAFDSWMLAGEMGAVIWLRSLRMMNGGKLAEREAKQMVSEKISAAFSFWPDVMAGGMDQSPENAAGRAMAHYKRPVSANYRRLSRNR